MVTFPKRLRFDRQELSGAFGDIGTDLPLIVGIIQATRLDPVSALLAFGLLQIFTGLAYGIPMAVQPLKAMAVIVISQKLPANVLLGGGLAIGLSMLVLTATGLLEWLARIVPRAVIRGIQLGLGLQLARLALADYLPRDSTTGYVLAAVGCAFVLVFRQQRRVPTAFLLLLAGALWPIVAGRLNLRELTQAIGVKMPTLHVPTLGDVLTGFWLLAIPQLPLSLGNSVFATHRLAYDLFPDRRISVKKIGFTYSLMNLVNPLLGGIPTCHGCGGLSGQYFFGARTGGAPVIYGLFYIVLGLVSGTAFGKVVELFPYSILGTILLFEAVALMNVASDRTLDSAEWFLCLLCGVVAAFLPNGYVVAMVGGVIAYHLVRWRTRRLEARD